MYWCPKINIFLLLAVSNADSKVLLHWSEEQSTTGKKGESIILQYKVNPLKYELAELLPHKETEMWPDGKKNTLLTQVLTNRE